MDQLSAVARERTTATSGRLLGRRLHAGGKVYGGLADFTPLTPYPTALELAQSGDEFHAATGTVVGTDGQQQPSAEPDLHALKKERYLLGETHNDGTWQARTVPWAAIPKMRESVTHLTTTGDDEAKAVKAVEGEVDEQNLPLEDRHARSLAHALRLQQYLLDDRVRLGMFEAPRDPAELGAPWTELKQLVQNVVIDIVDYLNVVNKWPAAGASKRGLRYVRIAGVLGKPEMKPMLPIFNDQLQLSPTVGEVKGLLSGLATYVEVLVELIDTRADGMMYGRWGADPISNRTAITDLGKQGSSSTLAGQQKAVATSNVNREEAMVRNIRAHPGPLLVQVGEMHVDRLLAAAGPGVVAVHEGVNFADITRRNRKT